jgi:hypothetical protein
MFNRVKPGQRWQPKADELNAMLAAGAAMRGVPSFSQVTERPAGNTLIRVKNITGEAVQRYRAFGLGESLVAELEDSNRVPDVVLELVEWESGPIAVIQQPLVDDEIGWAIVSGPTLLEVSDEGTDTDRQATPGTDGVCDPGSGPITLLMPRPEEGGFVLAALGAGGGGGATARVFFPTEAIPAAVLSGANLTPASRFCYFGNWDGTKWIKGTGGDGAYVFNTVTREIGASGLPIQAKLIDGIWVADVEDCG